MGPDAVAIERAFLGKNVSSALRLGEVRGVILAGAGRKGLPVVDYPPATVKVAVAGAGAAEKSMVARGVGALLGIEVDVSSCMPIQAVEQLVSRMVDNLIGNALKYGRQDGVNVVIRLTRAGLDEGVAIAKQFDGKVDLIQVSAGSHEVAEVFTVTHPSMFLPDSLTGSGLTSSGPIFAAICWRSAGA